MLTEQVFTNIVVAWAEETLDRHFELAVTPVIKSGQDAPRGSMSFVTVSLQSDTALDPEPHYCRWIANGDAVERTRSIRREVAFSIDAYRSHSYRIAQALQSGLEDGSAAKAFFHPHGVSVNRYDPFVRLRDRINDQWEDRTQFGLYLEYVDTVVERYATISNPDAVMVA